MSTNSCRHYNPLCATIDFHLKRCPRHRAGPKACSRKVKRRPDQLPEPWLFDSEKLLRELDRVREMVLLIPAPTHETHFAINNAISALWNLREQLRYLLSLHRDGQRSFAKKAQPTTSEKMSAPPLTSTSIHIANAKRARTAG